LLREIDRGLAGAAPELQDFLPAQVSELAENDAVLRRRAGFEKLVDHDLVDLDRAGPGVVERLLLERGVRTHGARHRSSFPYQRMLMKAARSEKIDPVRIDATSLRRDSGD